MTRKYFGTDGVRGAANRPPVTPDIIQRLAMAAGRHFHRGEHMSRVVIGKDTRLSGYMLETALTSGFLSMGMEVFLLGPMPTPAVAMLTRSMRCDLGVMVSASHNPYRDNGVKLFGPEGFKLSDAEERQIELLMDAPGSDGMAAPERLGRAKRIDDAPGRYIEFVKRIFPTGLSAEGLKVVVDCANGAAYSIAADVFYELGAEVAAIGVDPNGRNINLACGAMHPEAMCEYVALHGADIGFALDGDADRVVVCDEKGRLVDGDQVLALIAESYAESGALRGPVVGTVMSNLGLERHLNARGVDMVRAPVGDRYVMQAMREHQANIGGEQSGHLILADHATTGDGLAAALRILAERVRRKRPMSELSQVFAPVPQRLRNIRVAGDAAALLRRADVGAAVHDARGMLGAGGDLLIRPSGTEPLIRVMAQGDDRLMVERVIAELCAVLETAAQRPEGA